MWTCVPWLPVDLTRYLHAALAVNPAPEAASQGERGLRKNVPQGLKDVREN